MQDNDTENTVTRVLRLFYCRRRLKLSYCGCNDEVLYFALSNRCCNHPVPAVASGGVWRFNRILPRRRTRRGPCEGMRFLPTSLLLPSGARFTWNGARPVTDKPGMVMAMMQLRSDFMRRGYPIQGCARNRMARFTGESRPARSQCRSMELVYRRPTAGMWLTIFALCLRGRKEKNNAIEEVWSRGGP
jgi:hypothetical protein